jgi:hypothetical protein
MNATTKSEAARTKHLATKFANAPIIQCECGCGTGIKAVNEHGRLRRFVNGHSNRKYSDPKQYKKEYLIRHQTELTERRAAMRRVRRVELIRYKGGKCSSEGCDKSYNGKNGAIFEFHHLRDKRFGISAGLTDYSMETLKAEADKCVLLCSCCHAMTHSVEY